MDGILTRMADVEGWDPLRTFGVIVRVGSFTAAAHALGVSQSSVSRHVAALEARAGRPLFARRGRRIALTDAGRELAGPTANVESAMASVDRALAALAPTTAGEVRVTSAPELLKHLLAPRVHVLLAAHPELRLSLRGKTELESLTTGEADVALRVIAPESADLVRRRVGTLSYRAFGTRRALSGSPRRFVGYERSLAMLPEARWMAEHIDESRIVLRASLPDALAAVCASGPYVCVLPEALAALYPALRADGPVLFERPLYVVVHRELSRVPKIRAVTAWIAKCAASLSRG